MTSPCLSRARGPMGQPRPLSRGLPSSEGRVVAWCLKTGDGEAGGKGWGQVGPYWAQVCTLTLKATGSWFVFWGYHSLPGRHRSQTTGPGKGMKEARRPRHLLAQDPRIWGNKLPSSHMVPRQVGALPSGKGSHGPSFPTPACPAPGAPRPHRSGMPRAWPAACSGQLSACPPQSLETQALGTLQGYRVPWKHT